MNHENTKEKNDNRPAISYLRFSRPEQAEGTSRERQTSATKTFAEEHNLTLLESLEDLGVSAFRGKNKDVGELGRFLRLARDGKLPPKIVLVVESLDRISRQQISEALRLFLELGDAGVTIVTLQDRQWYEAGKVDLPSLILSLTIMSRAHEESLLKSKRLKAAWAIKRANAPTVKLTARLPAWLCLSPDRQTFELRNDRVAIIRRIFQLAENGAGCCTIAKLLNKDGIQPWCGGNGWHLSYIKKLLNNRSVIGEYQPHCMLDGRRTPIGEPLKDYFPPVVSEDLFLKVSFLRRARKHCGGRTGPRISNLFSHVAKCGYCGGSMVYVNKGEQTYLVCDGARRGMGCPYSSWQYKPFEQWFVRFVKNVDFKPLVVSATSSPTEALKSTIAAKQNELAIINERIGRLMDAIELGSESISQLVTRLDELKRRQTELQSEINSLDSKLRIEHAAAESCGDPREIFRRKLARLNEHSGRLEFREAVRSQIASMKFFPLGRCEVPISGLELHNNAEASALFDGRQVELTFNNGETFLLMPSTETTEDLECFQPIDLCNIPPTNSTQSLKESA